MQKHPNTGRLSFRRAYPVELRPFVPLSASGKQAVELKVSLGTSDAASPRFHAQYGPALARYNAIVAKAAKVASGAYDRLDAPTIAFLGKTFEVEWLAREEARLWAKGPEGAERMRGGWNWKLPDFKQWQADGDSETIEEEWTDSAQALLLSQGLTVAPDDADGFTALCRELNATAIRLSDIALARLAGQIVAAPPPPVPPAPKASTEGPAVPLLATFDAYAIAEELAYTTRKDWRQCIVALGAFLGHDDAARITKKDLRNWADHLLATNGVRGKPRLPVTVRGKYIGAIKAALNWAVQKELLTENVALGPMVKVRKRVQLRERAFTAEEATAILTAALVPANTGMSKGHTLARRWIPWIAAYTGARVGELAQLRAEDVRKIDGYWTINITPEAGKVKNKEARIVPLHSHLIEQGFLAVATAQGSGPIFYDPSRQRKPGPANRHIGKVGERIAQWVRQDVGITDETLQPNHAWRHLFKEMSFTHNIEERMIDALQGHAADTEGRKYAKPPVKARGEAIAKIPRFDLTGS
ncbi:recombinase XerD [Sphingomonas sp. UYP23]